MDINFIKEMIKDETENAKEYATAALEVKTTHPVWASKLMNMSDWTVKNVECLYKILEELNAEEKRMPSTSTYSQAEFDNEYKQLIDQYAETMSKMKAMKEMYSSRY